MATLPVPEADAQALLMVRAFEEADRDGVLDLPPEPAPDAESPEKGLRRRSRVLLARLDEDFPFLPAVRRVTRFASGFTVLVAAGALLVGLATSGLGPERRVNLLSLPLLGVLAWNLGVYLVVVLAWLVRGRLQPGRGLPRMVPPALVLTYLKRLLGQLRQHLAAEKSALVGRALRDYLDEWRPISRPLVEARARRLFHLGAALLAVGVVAGMYLRGLAFEYRATWESTFLPASAAEALIRAVVAPGRLLLSVETPPLAELRSPADGPAAPWIHLFAVTIGALVVVPRGLMALADSLRAAFLARHVAVPVDAPYYRSRLARGPTAIVVQPYSFSPSELARERLAGALRGLYGERAEVRWRASLEYGAETLPGLADDADGGLLLFNLAQTPEDGVHGALVRTLEAPWRLTVDAAAYRERLGEAGARRLEERVALWRRTLAAAGRPVLVVDLEGDDEMALATVLASTDEGRA